MAWQFQCAHNALQGDWLVQRQKGTRTGVVCAANIATAGSKQAAGGEAHPREAELNKASW